MDKYILFTCFGMVYRIGKRQYRRMLQAGAKGNAIAPEDFGAKPIGVLRANITDWMPDDYAEELVFLSE